MMQPRNLKHLTCSIGVSKSSISSGGTLRREECMSIHFVLRKLRLSLFSANHEWQPARALDKVELTSATDGPVT